MAVFSTCKRYRYVLWRSWQPALPRVMFIGLNPSVADGRIDDPTIRRCIGFARNWGYGGLFVCNLFALRATDPRLLLACNHPVGEHNDYFLKRYLKKSDRVVIAWGNHGSYRKRDEEVLRWIDHPYCLKINRSGQPAHPLYQRRDVNPVRYQK